MYIKAVRLEINIPSSSSLKDKRSFLQRVRTQVHKRLNVSIAETNLQDHHHLAELTYVYVHNDQRTPDRLRQIILEIIEAKAEAEVTNIETVDLELFER